MSNTVWILGAGFSASLGGPLLEDLFSERMRRELDATYEMRATSERPAVWFAYNLYHWGTGNTHRIGKQLMPGPKLWRNAEDYLDSLDRTSPGTTQSELIIQAIRELGQARRAGAGKKRLAPFLESPQETILHDVLMAAKRWMAAECCAFVKNGDPETERWRPYRLWLESLTAEDTIISFNYDRVLEVLADACGKPLHVVLPGTAGRNIGNLNVYKLHGSVDWERTGKESYQVSENAEFATIAEPDRMGIATPGASKSEVTKEMGQLWPRAIDHIKEAKRVVFVGYRFPETDNDAKIQLLTALRDTKEKGGPYAHVETVLGPDVDSVPSRRLRGLLEGIGFSDTNKITQHPMFADDFFVVNELLWVQPP